MTGAPRRWRMGGIDRRRQEDERGGGLKPGVGQRQWIFALFFSVLLPEQTIQPTLERQSAGYERARTFGAQIFMNLRVFWSSLCPGLGLATASELTTMLARSDWRSGGQGKPVRMAAQRPEHPD